MGKLGLAGTSLTAAIPGGILTYVLLMAVLHSMNFMPMPLKIAALALLVLSIMLTLFPLYILVMYRRDKVVVAKKGKGALAAGAAGGAGVADILLGDEEIFDSEEEFESEEANLTGHEPPLADDTEVFTDDYEIPGEVDELVEDEFIATPELEDAPMQAYDEDSFPTAEFTIEEDDELDEFGQTLQDIGNIEADDSFTAASDIEDEFSFEDFDDDEDQGKKK